MLVLALDCAGSGCGVAIQRDAKSLVLMLETMERGQDRRLVPMIETALHEVKLDYKDVDRIAVTTGPGSFTGLRIGLATARGLALAAEKPLLGFDRFQLYRFAFQDRPENLMVIIDGKRAERYVRIYSKSEMAEPVSMMTEEEIKNYLEGHPGTLVVGDKAATPFRGYEMMDEEEISVLARVAIDKDCSAENQKALPFYIRAPDVTFKKLSLQINPARLSDASLLSAIHQKSFPEVGWSEEQMKGSLALSSTLGFVACRGAETLGFLLAQDGGASAEILTFAVLPEARKQGIGNDLIKSLLSTLKKRRVPELWLEVAEDNHTATALYEKLGFRLINKRTGYYLRGSKKIDALQYRIDLLPTKFATS